jgi:hypothetical protein
MFFRGCGESRAAGWTGWSVMLSLALSAFLLLGRPRSTWSRGGFESFNSRGWPSPFTMALLMSRHNCWKLSAMSSRALSSFAGMVSLAGMELTSGPGAKLK